MSAAIVDWWGKIIKFHWLKHPKAVPKTKFEPENRLDFLAWSLKANKKLAKKINHFTIQLRSKNLTYFTNLNSFNIVKNTPRQHSQRLYTLHKVFSKMFLVYIRNIICPAAFPDAQELHYQSVWTENVFIFLCSSVRRFFFSFCVVGGWIRSFE